MARAHLRVATPGEQAPAAAKVAPLTVSQAAAAGSRLEELQAMRRRVASAIDDPNTPARDLAALTRRQIEMGKEIEAIQTAAAQEEHERTAASADEDWDASAI